MCKACAVPLVSRFALRSVPEKRGPFTGSLQLLPKYLRLAGGLNSLEPWATEQARPLKYLHSFHPMSSKNLSALIPIVALPSPPSLEMAGIAPAVEPPCDTGWDSVCAMAEMARGMYLALNRADSDASLGACWLARTERSRGYLQLAETIENDALEMEQFLAQAVQIADKKKFVNRLAIVLLEPTTLVLLISDVGPLTKPSDWANLHGYIQKYGYLPPGLHYAVNEAVWTNVVYTDECSASDMCDVMGGATGSDAVH